MNAAEDMGVDTSLSSNTVQSPFSDVSKSLLDGEDFEDSLGKARGKWNPSRIDELRRYAEDLSLLEQEKSRTAFQEKKIEQLYLEIVKLSKIIRDAEASEKEASREVGYLADTLSSERERFQREQERFNQEREKFSQEREEFCQRQEELQSLLLGMRTSTSWKISAPLRFVRNLFRR